MGQGASRGAQSRPGYYERQVSPRPRRLLLRQRAKHQVVDRPGALRSCAARDDAVAGLHVGAGVPAPHRIASSSTWPSAPATALSCATISCAEVSAAAGQAIVTCGGGSGVLRRELHANALRRGECQVKPDDLRCAGSSRNDRCSAGSDGSIPAISALNCAVSTRPSRPADARGDLPARADLRVFVSGAPARRSSRPPRLALGIRR